MTALSNISYNAGVMRAIGLAGSAVNIRQCAIIFQATQRVDNKTVSVDEFGLSSVGVCELFRPSLVWICNALPSPELEGMLRKVGVPVNQHFLSQTSQ